MAQRIPPIMITAQPWHGLQRPSPRTYRHWYPFMPTAHGTDRAGNPLTRFELFAYPIGPFATHYTRAFSVALGSSLSRQYNTRAILHPRKEER